MPLTDAQKTTLKAHLAANTATVIYQDVAVQIRNLPQNSDANELAAAWYNQAASPNYWVWRTEISRAEIYHAISPDNTVFDWQTFKAQSQTEQTAWIQMFMGDAAPFQNLSLRDGVFRIFSGNAAQNAQRAHIFACGRRKANNVEKLFAAAPASVGGVTISVSNGNVPGDALGGTTNPAVMGFEGQLTGTDVLNARNS